MEKKRAADTSKAMSDEDEEKRQKYAAVLEIVKEKHKAELEKVNQEESKTAYRRYVKALVRAEVRRLEEEAGSSKEKKRKTGDGHKGMSRQSKTRKDFKKFKDEIMDRVKVLNESAPTIIVDLEYFAEETVPERTRFSIYQQLKNMAAYVKTSLRTGPIHMTGLPESLLEECKNVVTEVPGFCEIHTKRFEEMFDQEKLVYLSADAEEDLETFDPSCCYVIGGILDRNSKKGATETKARDLKIRSARLPLGDYLKDLNRPEMKKVITINQVGQIIVDETASRNWKFAFDRSMPSRLTASEKHSLTDEQKMQLRLKNYMYGDLQKPFVVVILGGSTGIGYSFAKYFRRAGWTVVLVARNAERLEKAAHELRQVKPEKTTNQAVVEPLVFAVPEDCSERGGLLRLDIALKRLFEYVDAIIGCSGTFRWDDAKEVKQDPEFLMKQNYYSKMYMANHLLSHLLNGWGVYRHDPEKGDPKIFAGAPERVVQVNPNKLLILIGSDAGVPGFTDRVPDTENEQKYIESMVKVHDFGTKLVTALNGFCAGKDGLNLTSLFLEPTLVETPLTKQQFSHLASIDWTSVPSSDDYVAGVMSKVTNLSN